MKRLWLAAGVSEADFALYGRSGELNASLRELIASALGREVHLPPAPQIVAALGAALSVEARS